jgi:hypothetical protein
MNKCKLFNCELCGVKLTSDLISSQHYAGKAHEKKVVVALQEYAKVSVSACRHHYSGILGSVLWSRKYFFRLQLHGAANRNFGSSPGSSFAPAPDL